MKATYWIKRTDNFYSFSTVPIEGYQEVKLPIQVVENYQSISNRLMELTKTLNDLLEKEIEKC